MREELVVRSKDHPLSPPPAEDELRWWRRRRGALLRQTFLRFGLPAGLVPIVTTIVARPERLLGTDAAFIVGGGVLLAVAGTWLHARLLERDFRDQEIRWKRIREALVGDDGALTAPPEQPPSLSADNPR